EEGERHSPFFEERKRHVVDRPVAVVESDHDIIAARRILQAHDVSVLHEPIEMLLESARRDLHLQARAATDLVIDEDARAPELGKEKTVTGGEDRLGQLSEGSRHPAGSSAESSRSVNTGNEMMPRRCRGARLLLIPWSHLGCHPVGCSPSSRDGYQVLDSGRLPSRSQAMARPR